MARSYPHWNGMESLRAAFGRKVPIKYRDCCICGLASTRIATIQTTWFRSEDELYALCGPSNECRDALKRREGLLPEFSANQITSEK